MDTTMHHARILGPVAFRSGNGRTQCIPIGPCLVEGLGGRSSDVIWGPQGQSSAALPFEVVEAAREVGHLVILD